MDFRIDDGPWESIFVGNFRGHKVEIVSNPEKYFLTLIYDETDSVRKGVLVEGYKALIVRGQLDSFIETLPKPALGISKTTGDKTNKMLFVSFEPIYVDLKQEDYTRKIDNAIKASYDNIETIKELARASSIQLKEVSLAPEQESASILSDPLAARLLLSGLKKTTLQMLDLSGGSFTKKTGTIQLGLSKTREIIKEENKNFYRTVILGDTKSVLYANYILAENFLLDNTNTIIFDSNNYFAGLGSASKNEKELKNSLVEFEPAGFPVKEFKAKDSFKISFNEVDFALLFELLSVNDKEFEDKIINKQFGFDTAVELANNMSRVETLNEFQKLKFERLLQMIHKQFGDIFGKSIDAKDLLKKWPGNLGRATLIDTSSLDEKERIVFTQTTVRLLKDTLGEKINGETVFVIPDAKNIFSINLEKFVNDLLGLENKGIGLMIGSTNNISELDDTTTAQIKIVEGRDIAVSIKNEKNYRVNLRPSLSGNESS
jgi:hypothetical protein